MGWRYALQCETIPLDRQDLRLVKDGADASLPPTKIATRVGVGDAQFDHDALADGPIATLHSSSQSSNMLVPVHHARRYQCCSYSTPSLFCRRLCLIPHPAPCHLKRNNFPEIMQCLEHLLQGHVFLRPALPLWLVQCPKHQVIVAHDFRLLLAEKAGKKVFES